MTKYPYKPCTTTLLYYAYKRSPLLYDKNYIKKIQQEKKRREQEYAIRNVILKYSKTNSYNPYSNKK
jgi:hypothetical protein